MIESKSIHFPKYGHSTFESVDPAKRYLTLSAQQSFSGGCPESGPENVNGSRSIDIDPVTGDSTTSGDRYVNAGGTADSPTRKSGQTQSSSYDDPPNEKTDCEGTIRYFSTLSNENTTTMMQSNGKSELEDYEDTFVNGTPYAHQNTHANELRYDYRKTQFKFKWQADTDEEAKFPVKYFVLFTPEDDPDTTETNESTEVEIVGEPIQWNGSGDESPVFELDPDILKSGEDGTFRLLKVELDIDASDSSATKLNYTLPDGVPVSKVTLLYGNDASGWTKWDEKTGLTGNGFLSFDQSFIDLIGFEDPNPIDRDLKLEIEIAGQSLEFPVNADRIERMKTEVDLINGFWVDVGLRIFNHKIVERYHDMVYSVPASGELRQLFSTFASIDLGSSDFTAGTEAHKYNPDGGPEENMTFTDGSTIGASPNYVSWSLSSQQWINTSSVTVNEGVCTNSGISVLTGLGPALEIYQTNKSVRVDID